MANATNEITITGRLTQDPELRTLQSGQKVTNLNLRVVYRAINKDGEVYGKNVFVEVPVWGNRADACATYLRAGSHVYVKGRLKNEEWTKPDGTKGYKTKIEGGDPCFLGKKNPVPAPYGALSPISFDTNLVELMGNITKDPEVFNIENGGKKVVFSIATEHGWQDKTTNEWKKEVSYHNCIVWGDLAAAAELLKKGDKVNLFGEFTVRSWDKPDGTKGYKTEIVAKEINALGFPPVNSDDISNGSAPTEDDMPEQADAGTQGATTPPAAVAVETVKPEDLPF